MVFYAAASWAYAIGGPQRAQTKSGAAPAPRELGGSCPKAAAGLRVHPCALHRVIHRAIRGPEAALDLKSKTNPWRTVHEAGQTNRPILWDNLLPNVGACAAPELVLSARRPARILLTGFEPFGGDTVNPSWLVAQALHGQRMAGATVHALQLPCVFGQSLVVLQTALQAQRPHLVLCLGLAAGRAEMSVERVAINVDDARIPDNAGASPVDQPVVAGAPAAYFSTLPIKAMVHAMQSAGVPAVVSQTAGTFVCNHAFFGLMHLLRRRRGVRGGFMHVPLLSGQATASAAAAGPVLSLEAQCLGVQVALATAMNQQVDRQEAGGAIA